MIFILIAICVSLPGLSHKIRSSIVVSELTSKDLVSEFTSLSNLSSNIPVFQFSNSTLAALKSYRPNLIFDYSESLQYSQKLKDFAIAHKILFFSHNFTNLYQRWVFTLHPPPKVEASALRTLLKHLEWSNYHMISSETARSRAINSHLSPVSFDTLPNAVDQEIFDRYTAKEIKASGNWKTLVLNEEPGASKALLSLENSRIYKERCGFIVSTKGSWGNFKLGTLVLVEEGLEEAKTEAQYELKAILRAINISEHAVQNFTVVVSNEIIAKTLEEQTSNGIISSRYSILNYKDKLKIVGEIEGEKIRIWEDIVFPGNVTQMDNTPPKISLSANTGAVQADGSINFITIAANLGLQPMVQLVNADPSILSNFELEVYETDCDYFLFSSDCMKKHIDHIGLVHIAGNNSTTVQMNLRLMQDNNINIPHISTAYSDEELFDKTQFPEVLITLPSFIWWYSILPYILKAFGWDQIVILFNYHVDPSFSSVFLHNAESINLNVLNTAKNMFIPFFKTEKYYEEVKEIVQFIYDSKCKIVVLMVDPHSHLYFMEALYDFGFRKDDLVLIFMSSLSSIIDYPELYGFDRKKVIELGDGSVSMGVAEYIGEYGQELEKTIASLIYPNPTTYSCYIIDSLMLAVHTIDLMVQIGGDFEEFEDLMHLMRGIQFTGCTGRISIDSAGNGRRDIMYSLYNFYMTGDEWNEVIAGSYTVGVTVPFKIDRAIIWPNGMTEVPEDTRYDPPCGFSPSLVKENIESQNLSITITVTLYCFVCLFCLFIWYYTFNFEREFLTTKREMYFEDGVLIYLPLIEALQFLALGPSFSKANYYLALLCSIVILDVDKIIDSEYGDFWIITGVVLGVCTLWCFSLCVTLSKKEEILPRFFRDLFDVVGYKMIQVFCQILFVALNVLVLKLFDCKEGIGDEATDSILKYDCRTSCWEGKHLYYVIGACIVLIPYNMLAMVSRVVSDDLMDYVSVNTQPTYAFWKGIFQLILVTLNLHLKEDHEVAFGVVYCLLFVCWSLFVFKTDSYNYKRLNGWVKVITISVCTHQILILGYISLNFPGLAVIILQVIIVVVCVCVGFYFQFTRSSSMLYKRKGRNYEKLLKFAFTNRVEAKNLTEHQLDYVNQNAIQNE